MSFEWPSLPLAQRTSAVTPVAKGGTGSTSAAAARTALDVPQNGSVVRNDSAGVNAIGLRWSGGRIVMKVDATDVGQVANFGDIQNVQQAASNAQGSADSAWNRAGDAQGTANGAAGAADDAKRGNLFNDSYNRNLTGTRRTAWIQDNGQLGYASSSERYKKNIHELEVTDEQVAILQLVTFQWRAAVATEGEEARVEVGLIAERLVDAGLGWAVFFNEDGQPEGINYDMIGLVVLPVVQRLLLRVSAIEAQLNPAPQE